MNNLSIKYLFKMYQYFKNHLIIKNVIDANMCNLFDICSEIEKNSFLLFSIPHILELININYNIDQFNTNYMITQIKTEVAISKITQRSFLDDNDFKVIIPLSNCTMHLDNELNLSINRGNIVVFTGDREFIINEKIKFIYIGLKCSVDPTIRTANPYMSNGTIEWMLQMPFKDNTCLKYAPI